MTFSLYGEGKEKLTKVDQLARGKSLEKVIRSLQKSLENVEIKYNMCNAHIIYYVHNKASIFLYKFRFFAVCM